MIYTEKANFPYPLLTNNSPDYKNSIFDFDVDLNENTNEYICIQVIKAYNKTSYTISIKSGQHIYFVINNCSS